MIDMDDPAHLLRRKLVNAGFTRKRVKDKEPSIGALCDTLIDAVCERGECDFVRDIAAPLPMAVIGDMLGVLPEEREMLLKWSDDMVTGLSSHIDEDDMPGHDGRLRRVHASPWTSSRSGVPNPTDDLFSVLVHAEVDGQRMSDDEIVSETLLILIGGDETTRHTLSGGTEQLLRHRDQWERLQSPTPTLLPSAIEEMLRWTSPVKNMCRTLTADTEFHGTAAARGREDHADVRVGQLRRGGVRRSGQLPHRPEPQQPHGVRLRHALLPGQPAGPARAEP